MTHKKQHVREFADRIKGLGFNVYLAASQEYGFITDETESRVLSFGVDFFTIKLTGNYSPPSHESGTGWTISDDTLAIKTADDVRRLLYASPHFNCGNGWKRFTDVKEYLKQYGPSSKFTQI